MVFRPHDHSLLVAEDLYDLPADLPHVGRRFYSLDRGTLCIHEAAGCEHGGIWGELFARLHRYVHEHDLGVVFGADLGFVLHRHPDTVRSPDVAFIARNRVPLGDAVKKFFEGAPDFAVEVVSPSDRQSEVDRKVAQFLDAGTRLVWVIDPSDRSVTIHRPGAASERFQGDDRVDGGDVIPGFQITVRELFPAYLYR